MPDMVDKNEVEKPEEEQASLAGTGDLLIWAYSSLSPYMDIQLPISLYGHTAPYLLIWAHSSLSPYMGTQFPISLYGHTAAYLLIWAHSSCRL